MFNKVLNAILLRFDYEAMGVQTLDTNKSII
jgi:hypothetical protein